MLYLQGLYKDFGEKTILENCDLTIYDGEKVGIIGNNGQGKSTLLNIIAGIDNDFKGVRSIDGKIAYLQQSSFINFETLPLTLAENGGELMKWLKQLNFNGKLDNIENLSGGEKTKLAFAIAFVQNPQILLLDEPTNHLDLTGKKVITDIINEFWGTVIIVSHDIDFLNQTVNSIVKIENAKLKTYAGNYDCYLDAYNKEQQNIRKEYEKHQRKVAEIEENIRKIKEFARIAERDVGRQDRGNGAAYMQTKTKAMVHAKKMNKTASSRVTKLEKQIDKAPEKPIDRAPIKYAFDQNPLKTKLAVKFTEVNFSYADNQIFNNLNFEILSGERVGIIGDNGTGKTTLINLICGKLSAKKGTIYKPPALKIEAMKQDIYDLDENATINELSLNGDNEYRRTFLTNLVNMNIDKTRFNIKIKNLSLGERMRIKLNFIILSDANFIILDEPTNHLDIENKDFMLETLKDYKGTILIISHDLNLIKNVCNKVYKIQNKTLNECNI